MSHGVIAGELLVGVRAGVRVAEEGKIRHHAQHHERIGKDDDGGVAGGDLGLQAADLDDEDERRRHEADHDGLLAEYAKTFPEGAVIVKGLRANTDFENEFQMALINKKINPELDTMFLTASQKYTFLSSSVVKELAGYGADLTPFVPCEIIEDVRARAMRSE